MLQALAANAENCIPENTCGVGVETLRNDGNQAGTTV